MCYNYEFVRRRDRANARKKKSYKFVEDWSFEGILNGFAHPRAPIVTQEEPDTARLYRWGLIPHWAKDTAIAKNTLNARIETIHEKPAFRQYTQNRCLVLATAFYEWQWLDEKGKQKQKYRIALRDEDSFAFAGLYATWVDRNTGETLDTFTILTTGARGIMKKIHNSKLRQPVIVPPGYEDQWLSGEPGIVDLEPELTAEEV